MIQAKCTQKFRDKTGKIYGYRLIDLNGQTQDVEPENLKQAIKAKQINVINLTLTSDNRLVDTNEKQLQSVRLGKAPVKQKSNKESFFDALKKVADRFCKNIGGHFDGIEYTDEELSIGYINDVYNPDVYKGLPTDYKKRFGVEIKLHEGTSARKPYIELSLAGDNGHSFVELSVYKELEKPLYSKKNIEKIVQAFNEFTDKVQKWIYNDKNSIEQENDWFKELHKDNNKVVELTTKFMEEAKAGTWELKHKTGKINTTELKEFAISRGYISNK